MCAKRSFSRFLLVGLLCPPVAACSLSHGISYDESQPAPDAAVEDASSRLDMLVVAPDASTECDESARPDCLSACGLTLAPVCSDGQWQCPDLIDGCHESYCNPSERPDCGFDSCEEPESLEAICEPLTGRWHCSSDRCLIDLVDDNTCSTNTSALIGTACSVDGAKCGVTDCCDDTGIECVDGHWRHTSFDCGELVPPCLYDPYVCGDGECVPGTELCVRDDTQSTTRFYCARAFHDTRVRTTCNDWSDIVSVPVDALLTCSIDDRGRLRAFVHPLVGMPGPTAP